MFMGSGSRKYSNKYYSAWRSGVSARYEYRRSQAGLVVVVVAMLVGVAVAVQTAWPMLVSAF